MNTSGKLSRRDFLRGTAIVGAMSVLAACAPAAPATEEPAPEVPEEEAPEEEAPAPEAITLRWITNHGEADVPLFLKVRDNFQATHEGITIEHLDVVGNEFYDTINAQGAAGDLPDSWYTRTFDTPVYAAKGWTISLQPYIDADPGKVNVDDFWPAMITQMTWNGDLWALPYDFSNIGIYYNKDAFDAAGQEYPPDQWKWDQLVELGKNFVEKDDSGAFTKWAMMNYTWDWVFMGHMLGWGGQIWSDDFKQIVVDSAPNRECLEYFASARDEGLFPEAGAAPEGIDLFSAVLVPMCYQGSWATVQLRDTIADKFDFDCTTMPRSPTDQTCINGAGGAWGIATNCKYPDDCWEWTWFLTNTESTNILISEPLRSIPGRQSSVPLWEEKAAEGGLPPKNVGIFPAQFEEGYASAYPPYWRDYSTAWSNEIVPYINGVIDDDAATVLARFQEEVQRLADQYFGV